jgi:hypothetical protein
LEKDSESTVDSFIQDEEDKGQLQEANSEQKLKLKLRRRTLKIN